MKYNEQGHERERSLQATTRLEPWFKGREFTELCCKVDLWNRAGAVSQRIVFETLRSTALTLKK